MRKSFEGLVGLVESLAQCQQRIGQLEETVAEQQAVIAEQQAVIARQQEMAAVYQEQLTQAAEQLRLLRRMVFGQRRERYTPSPDQKLLFVPEVVEGLDAKAQNAEEAAADSPPRPRRKPRRPRIEFPQFWEHRQKDYPLAAEELPCGCCGAARTIIRTHVTKRLEMEEAKLYVVEEVRYTYGCSACHDGAQMVTTQRPAQAVEKSPFGPSILAWLVTWKFLHHLPVYRQQELLLGPLKRWLSRALLCGLLGRTAQALRPLERLIRQRVLASAVVNADETEVRMLKPGHGKTIAGYLSGYAGDADHRYVFHDFRPSRSRDGPAEMLADYMLNRWDAFVRHTSDGRIPIDNNVIERLLRPVAIGRKNYLFFGSEKGGQTAATLYTLVQSARRNCVDVWPYLTDVLRRIAAIAPTDTAALEALLPDRWVATHPEHRLQQREEESREAQARRRRKRAACRIAAVP
jgi:transposase/uncharacterized coiled-coil protein SlyX